MKKFYSLFFASVVLMTACKKEDKPATPQGPNDLANAIGSQMAKVDSLSTFNAYFKTASFTDADVKTGLTLFALPNSAFGGNPGTPGNKLPDASLLKDYIVPGVLRTSDLTNNKTLTTLSGKTLIVTVSGDTVRINGVIIVPTPVIADTKYAVFIAKKMLLAAAPAVVTVWDATQWSSSAMNGQLVAGATVSLYAHQQDYTDHQNALYTATTGADGKVVFSTLAPGDYYVVASKGAINNVYNIYADPYNGNFLGFGITGVTMDGYGNYFFLDANGDGKVDNNDIIAQPFNSFTASTSTDVKLEVSMGYAYKQLKTLDEAQAKLNGVYAGLSTMYKDLLMIDGSMSDDAGCETGGSTYCTFDNFSFTANTSQINQIWNNAYFTNINALNYILRDAATASTGTDAEKKDLIAQTRTLRAYIYLQLITYFGDVPQHGDLANSFHPAISRKSTTDIYNFIVAELTASAPDLPLTRSNKYAVVRNAALGLLAKAALWKKDYAKVLDYTNQIISSGQHILDAQYSYLYSTTGSEIIWCPQFAAIGPGDAWYYPTSSFGGYNITQIPVLRYAHILLMNAEAKIMTGGSLPEVQTTLNQIRSRDNLTPVTITSQLDAAVALNNTWQQENYRQGDRFINLLRWVGAQAAVGTNGFHSYNNLLPIPLAVLNGSPGISQNPGY